MKKYLLFLLLLPLLIPSAYAADQLVVNQTTCTASNNLGTGVNVYGQSFLYNATSPKALLNEINFRFINASTTLWPSTTSFVLRLHYNESSSNSTILFSKNITSDLMITSAVAGTCGAGTFVNITNLGWGPLNYSGNYTWSIEAQNEGTGQWWEFVNTANPYLDGKELSGVSFIPANDVVFRIWGKAANFSVRATDAYTGASLSTFNATVNGTFYSTTSGLITTNIPADSGLVNVSVAAPTYFNRSHVNFNTSADLSSGLHQVELYVTAKNIVTNATINVFQVQTNQQNFTTTTGTAWVNISSGSQPMNFTATGYLPYSKTYTFAALDNITDTAYLTPLVLMNLYNESDGSPFYPNQTNGTVLRVFCSNQTSEFTLTNQSENISLSCTPESMRMFVTYGNTTYYRTLLPAGSVTNVSWYLINLNQKTAVQKIFSLNDLAGQFNSGDLIFQKIVNNTQVTIHAEGWDIENKVIVYLILYDSYIVSLTDNDNNTRLLGPFLADTTASHVITVPNIPFSPSQEIDDFTWGYLQSPNRDWLYMNYNSTAGTLSSVNWLIVNASNVSQIFLNTTFVTVNGSANYTGMLNGTVYLSNLTYTHTSFSTHDDARFWNSLNLPDFDLPGFSDQAGFKKWFSIAFIVVVGLMFTGLNIAAGAASFAVFTGLFYWVQWLPISAWIVALFGVIAVIAFIVEEGIR